MALVAVAAAAGGAIAKKKGGLPPGKVLVKKTSAPSLVLETVDREAGRVMVLVGGAARAPEARLFTFHDDRDRHFIAMNVHCEAASSDEEKAPGKIRCMLELPRAYAAAKVQALTVTLHGREIAARAEDVKEKFAAAPMPAPIPPPPSLRPTHPSAATVPPAALPDGGMAPPAAAATDDWWNPPPATDGGAAP